jgi:hypothetical protein
MLVAIGLKLPAATAAMQPWDGSKRFQAANSSSG